MNLRTSGDRGTIEAYFHYLGAKSDKLNCLCLIGNNIFGIEDMDGGDNSPNGTLRDRDFNDSLASINLDNSLL
ncbi:hypothetical protein [Chamaesiphon minutus]|uniref:hypothetical protein n=1 Tax=Chamaesiphon minutus TaxID=1173032 RepID=UPI00031B32EA|nr:hypothetical protein [Chamaesiphon minutus]